MRKLSLLLIAVGFLTIFYPFLEGVYVSYWQQKLLVEMEDLHKVQQTAESNVITISIVERDNHVEETEFESTELSVGYNALGIMYIEKINLSLPILDGTSSATLKFGAGLLEETAYPGNAGNSVITAHRSHSYGIKFNRLDELEIGDRITIYRLGEVYEYDVSFTQIMKTEEIYAYTVQGDHEILTLITCHPLYRVDPPYRIVVQAERYFLQSNTK